MEKVLKLAFFYKSASLERLASFPGLPSDRGRPGNEAIERYDAFSLFNSSLNILYINYPYLVLVVW